MFLVWTLAKKQGSGAFFLLAKVRSFQVVGQGKHAIKREF